jgi:uncharacterized protein (DUF433 family)
MAVTVHPIETIISDPKIRGGRPIIAGTTLRVSDVVAYYLYAGHTPDELAAGFNLTLGQVHAALAYYHFHRGEVDAELRNDAENAEESLKALAKQGKLIRFE